MNVIRRASQRPERAKGGTADTLLGMATDAVISTFAAYGLALTQAVRTGPAPRALAALAKEQGTIAPTLGAIVSFAGSKVRGDLLLASTLDVLEQTRPGTGKHFSALRSAAKLVMMRDWMGELANQALGRVKAGLPSADFSFETRPPVPLSAEAMASVTPRSPDTRPTLFRGEGGTVGFWFDVLYDGELDTGNGAPGGSKEGNLLLF